jgi:predicted flavoprotein YhiN
MSGPAVLKLSAWEQGYDKTISLAFSNWLNDVDDAEKKLKELKQEHAKKAVSKKSPFDFQTVCGKA